MHTDQIQKNEFSTQSSQKYLRVAPAAGARAATRVHIAGRFVAAILADAYGMKRGWKQKDLHVVHSVISTKNP